MRGIIWGMGCGGIISINWYFPGGGLGRGVFGGYGRGRGGYTSVFGVGLGLRCGYDMTFYYYVCM